MIYLDIDIRPFPLTRRDKGYYIFVDRMKEGSANTISRNLLECNTKSEINSKIKEFLSSYTKEYHYLRLWHSI